jgi:hypothetical protein
MDLTLTTLIPQKEDDVKALNQRLLAQLATCPEQTGLASAARTANTYTAITGNPGGHRGIMVRINISAVPGLGGIRLMVESGPSSNTVASSVTFYEATARTAVQRLIYVIYPGAGLSRSDVLGTVTSAELSTRIGPFVRISVQHATADSYTYSLEWCFLP